MGNLIEKVLESYGADLTRVRETGWQDIRCPFTENHAHADRNKSARVNLSVGGFRCFGCGVKGSALTLIMEREKLDYDGAVEYAASVLGTSLGAIRRPAPEHPRLVSRLRNRLFD